MNTSAAASGRTEHRSPDRRGVPSATSKLPARALAGRVGQPASSQIRCADGPGVMPTDPQRLIELVCLQAGRQGCRHRVPGREPPVPDRWSRTDEPEAQPVASASQASRVSGLARYRAWPGATGSSAGQSSVTDVPSGRTAASPAPRIAASKAQRTGLQSTSTGACGIIPPVRDGWAGGAPDGIGGRTGGPRMTDFCSRARCLARRMVRARYAGALCASPDIALFAVSLSGVGERAHQALSGITLTIHIQDVAAVIDAEELSAAVPRTQLRGHGDHRRRRPHGAACVTVRWSASSYVDAVVPRPERLVQHPRCRHPASASRNHCPRRRAGTARPGDLWVSPERDRNWAARRMTPHSGGVYDAVLTSDPRRVASLRRVFIDWPSPALPTIAAAASVRSDPCGRSLVTRPLTTRWSAHRAVGADCSSWTI